MSRLVELIQKLCPDGVPFYSLGEVCEIRTGKGITKKDSSDEGRFPIISGGKDPMGFYYCANRKANTVTISRVGANAGFVNYIERDFYLNDKCFSVIPLEAYSRQINRKYLFLILKKSEKSIMEMQSEGGVPTINTQKLAGVCIPIPPLSVQEKLVCFLDDFTDKTKELQESLNGELQARKRQYEFYMNYVLNNSNEISYKRLGELCDIGDGLHSTPVYDEAGEYYFINGNNLKGGTISVDAKTKRVSKTEYVKHKIDMDKHTVLMSINGTIGKMAIYNDEPVVLGKSAAYFRVKSKNLNYKFLFYYLQCSIAKDYYSKNLTGATIMNLGLKALRNFYIPIPDIELQDEIVKAIEKLDKYHDSIEKELSEEIKARQKQYEYYRDKLLTFKEKTC